MINLKKLMGRQGVTFVEIVQNSVCFDCWFHFKLSWIITPSTFTDLTRSIIAVSLIDTSLQIPGECEKEILSSLKSGT